MYAAYLYEVDGRLILEMPGRKAQFYKDLHQYVPRNTYDQIGAGRKLVFNDSSYYGVVAGLVERHFPIHTNSSGYSGSIPAIKESDPFAVMHLTKTAPFELVKAAYKVLMKLYHPDAGGDPDKAQEINAAYSEIKEIFDD